MLRRQVSLRAASRDRLLRTHHNGIGEAPEHHDQRQHAIHHAYALMIDRREPLAPQIRPISLERDQRQNVHYGHDHESRCTHDDRLVEWDRAPVELAKQIHLSTLCDCEQTN